MLRLAGYTLLMFALGALLVLAAGAGQARTELAAARHVYEQAGFRRVRGRAHHSFGRDLVAETWRLTL